MSTLTRKELERRLDYPEAHTIATLSNMVGLGRTAELLGVSPRQLDRLVAWRVICMHRETLAKVRARLSGAIPVWRERAYRRADVAPMPSVAPHPVPLARRVASAESALRSRCRWHPHRVGQA